FAAAGGDLGRVASVASFFISRIDSAVDAAIATRLKAPADATTVTNLTMANGRVAIANAKVAYQAYRQLFARPAWAPLAASGAQTQRLLWASTGTKNPQYRDTLYVEELIGPDTVNTVPPTTLDAFRDHGHARPSLLEGVAEAQGTLAALAPA